MTPTPVWDWPVWDWPNSAWKRPQTTVSDFVYWSYAWLIATRIAQDGTIGRQKGRNHMAAPLFYQLRRGEISITSLERDLFQAILAQPTCLHCGAKARLTMDHLIPRSCGGAADAENIVTSCAPCNSARGNMDLMLWYRRQRRFPCLVRMRQYLKICHKYSLAMGLLDANAMRARELGLPFDPAALPEKFPPLTDLRYDMRS